MVTLFKIMELIARKAFKKMYPEFKFLFSVLLGCKSKNFLNWIFHNLGHFLAHLKKKQILLFLSFYNLAIVLLNKHSLANAPKVRFNFALKSQ